MKETEKKKQVVRVTEGNPGKEVAQLPDGSGNKAERLKKPLIFALMGAVFLGCMYLIFSPSGENENPLEKAGINDAVPQATDAGLQSDKQKAYEQELLDKRDQEKRKSLQTLSEYWSSDSTKQEVVQEPEIKEQPNQQDGNALSSYRNVQSTLGSFYQNNDENEALRKELEAMKEELSQKKAAQDPMQNQLALMEKSYEMAAKYFPGGTGSATKKDSMAPTAKESFVAFRQERKNVASPLPQEGLVNSPSPRNQAGNQRAFSSAVKKQQTPQIRNGIRACVHESQTIAGEGNVKLRLLETAHSESMTIAQGSLLTASAKFQAGRLQLKISSIEHQGNIIPVEILVYDIDGQLGLNVPITPEVGAASEMAANMSQTAGTNMMLTRSAGQQIAADLSRGVVQGVSGYFSKKVRVQKVALKAGHQSLPCFQKITFKLIFFKR